MVTLDAKERLRKIVAQLAGLEPEAIGDDFSLRSRGLQSSVRRAALAAAIRRHLNVNVADVYSVVTFRELEAAVLARGLSPVAADQPAKGFLAKPAALTGLSVSDELACGIDIERVDAMPIADDYWEHEFYKDNFSKDEIAYCLLQENPRMHFAARWCAKEAFIKCDPALKGQSFATLEVVRNESGEVSLAHHVNGTAKKSPLAVSLSHTDTMAAAVVVRGPK